MQLSCDNWNQDGSNKKVEGKGPNSALTSTTSFLLSSICRYSVPNICDTMWKNLLAQKSMSLLSPWAAYVMVWSGVLTLGWANKPTSAAESTTTGAGKRRDPDRKASLCPLLMDFTGHSWAERKDRKWWHSCVIHQECLVKLVRKHLLEPAAAGESQLNDINATNSEYVLY